MASPNMASLLLPLVGLQLFNRLDFETPETKDRNIMFLRMGYVCSLLFSLTFLFVIYNKINSIADKTIINVPKPKVPSFGQDPAVPVDGSDSEDMTIQEHDIREVKKVLKSVMMGCVIISVIHYKWGTLAPLFMQACMGLKNLYDSPLVKLHLFGNTEITRPFKEPENPLAKLMNPDGAEEEEKAKEKESKKDKKDKKAKKEITSTATTTTEPAPVSAEKKAIMEKVKARKEKLKKAADAADNSKQEENDEEVGPGESNEDSNDNNDNGMDTLGDGDENEDSSDELVIVSPPSPAAELEKEDDSTLRSRVNVTASKSPSGDKKKKRSRKAD